MNTTVFDKCSRHAECRACGKRIGMRFEESVDTEQIDEEAVRIDKRCCQWCSYQDYSAQVDGKIVTLAASGVTCDECKNNARVTVVDTEQTVHSHTHYCDEHAHGVISKIAKYIDWYQRIHPSEQREGVQES